MRFSAPRSLFALHNGSRSVNWHQTSISREIRRKSTLCAIAGNKVGILTTTYNLLTFFHNVTQLTLTLVILSTHSQPLSLLGQWTVKSWISFLTHPSGKTCKSQTKNRVDSCLHVKRLGTRFSNVSKLFGWHKSLCNFNKNTFWALKLGSYFAFPYIWKISKQKLFTASGS